MRRRKINLRAILFLAVIAGLGIFLLTKKHDFTTGNSPTPTPKPKSVISGLECADFNRRPFAVMLSGDAVARPLSGLKEADMVFNMPVTTGDITRMMAVYVCGNPTEIGSVRSARHDYIPLARGLDAIYAHWGGSHFALDKLNAKIMDNIDALPNPYNAFYRKSGIEMPHNGFTSMSRLLNSAEKLKYRLANQFAGYPHQEDRSQSAEVKSLNLGFTGIFAVRYDYDPATNSYLRFRGGTKEIDKVSGQQIIAKNVVVMFAKTQPLEDQYNEVQVEGEGNARVYLNGIEIAGKWKKNASDQKSKLFFYDANGQEINFVPGQIWVEIIDPSQEVTWK